MSANAYDVVDYPTTIIPPTHPDVMATIATLHGLTPPPIETARVLELGGGDALNLISLAVAYPEARFVSIDLAAVPVGRGRRLVELLGLDNIEVRVGDIVAEAQTLDGPFDYIIAHGVYAWVPEIVRSAIMTLAGRALSADGIVYISYNALPGGHLRQALRDMMLHHVDGIGDPQQRVEAAQAFLLDFGEPRDPDLPGIASLRQEALSIARKRPEVLHHDELGEVFAPQALKDVVAAANACGLSYLNEAQAPMIGSGLLLDEDDARGVDAGDGQAAFVRRAQTLDYEQLRFFSHTLLIRSDRRPSRTLDVTGVHRLWLATRAQPQGDGRFTLPNGSFTVGDTIVAAALTAAAGASPAYVRIADVIAADDEERLVALVQLYRAGAVDLHSAAYPAVVSSERPFASPLARMTVASGQQVVVTLNHALLNLEDAGARAFLMLLDGSRDMAMLDREWQQTPHAGEIGAGEAFRTLARFGLVQR